MPQTPQATPAKRQRLIVTIDVELQTDSTYDQFRLEMHNLDFINAEIIGLDIDEPVPELTEENT